MLSWAWRQSIPDAGTKLVLVKLADMSNDDGICWPSQSTLALHCGLNERSIRYKLQLLGELGLIRVERRVDEKGVRQSNVYRLSSGNVLPMEPAAKSSGNPLPKNHHLEPSELKEEASGNPLPVGKRSCPECGVESKDVDQHLHTVHDKTTPAMQKRLEQEAAA